MAKRKTTRPGGAVEMLEKHGIDMPRKEAVPAKGVKFGFKEVTARAFITIKPTNEVWKTGSFKGAWLGPKGAFVRLQPPPGTTPELIEQGRQYFGAFSAAVRVDMPPKASDAQPGKAEKVELGAGDAREVVWQLYERSPMVIGSRGAGGDDGEWADEVGKALEESMSAGGL